VLSWAPFALAFPLLPIWVLSVAHSHVPDLWTVGVIGIPTAIAIHLSDALPDRDADLASGSGGLATRLPSNTVAVIARALILFAAALSAGLAWLAAAPAIAVFSAVIAAALVAYWQPADRSGLKRYAVPLSAALLGAGWVMAITS